MKLLGLIVILISYMIGFKIEAAGPAVPSKKFSKQHLQNMLRDAQFSQNRGDLFRSYKLYEYIRVKSSNLLVDTNSVYPYYSLVSNLKGESELLSVCSQDIKGAKNQATKDLYRYHCARVLMENQSYARAQRILEKIARKTPKWSLLRATNFLVQNKPQLCLKELEKLDKESQAAKEIADLLTITLARCHAGKMDFLEAEKLYKSVASNSKNYLAALQELSWVLFKAKRIGESKSTIDVLTAAYDEDLNSFGKLSRSNYYSLRFLRIYMSTLQSGVSSSDQEAKALERDLASQSFKKTSRERWNEFFTSIEKQTPDWSLITQEPGELSDLMSSLNDWGLANEERKLRNSIRFFLGLGIEHKRKALYKSEKSYNQAIASLLSIMKSKVIDLSMATEEKLNARKRAFDLNLQLANRKENLLSQSKGIRSIEEAKRIYKVRENYLSGWLGEVD